MPRMRKKKNYDNRIAACQKVHITSPSEYKGQWREKLGFETEVPIYLELGCGKGQFATTLAKRHPNTLVIAMEREPTAALIAMEKAIKQNVDNLFFIAADINFLREYFDNNEVNRIYLNFSDPWTRQNKPKRRLTYRSFLDVYHQVLKDGSDLFFKTDNDLLFDFSLEELEQSKFKVLDYSRDLHRSKWAEQNIQTEFEAKYVQKGISIKVLHARNTDD